MTTIPKDELEKINGMIAMAKENLEADGSLMPIMFIRNSKSNEIHIVGMHFPDYESKVAIVGKIKKMISSSKADSVLTILESWMLINADMDEYSAGVRSGKYKSMGDHPMAKECVWIGYENRYGEWAAAMPIVTKGDKKTFELVELRSCTGQMSGLFHGLINFKVLLGAL